MNRIDKMFLDKKGQKVFIPFITAGDPDIGTTMDLVFAMEEAGADLIELGVPFSDPIAEGPVIQEANARALKNGVNLDIIFDAVGKIRKKSQIPLVFLMYYNSLFKYGLERFFKACKEYGIDGVIIPDLPYEESGEIAEYEEKYNVYQISLISPTSHDRIEKIAKSAKGFLYCVSSLGVTGARDKFETDFKAFFDEINKYAKIPKCLGFGIKDETQAKLLREYADGIIVGSAVVALVKEGKDKEEKIRLVKEYVSKMAKATKE